MLYYIVKEGLANQAFIEARTEGYDDFCEALLQLDIDAMEAVSGVDRELVRSAAIAYATAGSAMSFHGLGVTEHSQGTFTVMQIADLALITGNIGRRGVGVNPLRGQNNVQGMADMGAQPYQGAGYLDVTDPAIIKQYEAFYGVDMPTEIGWKIPQMYQAAIEGKLKAVWVIGEDMVQTDPNTKHVRKALESLELLVVQEIFMTPTAQMADVVLPGASFLEKSGTFTNGERRIQRVNQVVEPIEGSKPDGQIVVELMNRMGYAQPDYDPETLLEEISRIVPFFAGVKWNELGDNGKQWPVAVGGQDTPILHTESFKRGKGLFVYNDFKETEEVVANAEKFPYILTTNRNLEHYNCGAQTRRTDNVKIVSEDVIFIHPDDAEENGIEDADMVCVESDRGKVDIKAKVSDEIKKGVLSTTFHFPEILVNNLTSSVSDSIAMCPEYKVVSVRIRKARKVGMRAKAAVQEKE
jgi:formate dehydrogenase major subunit